MPSFFALTALLIAFSLLHAIFTFGAETAFRLFLFIYGLTFAAEIFGTSVSIFGAHYEYVPLMWPDALRHLVMVVIPAMWFMCFYPSFMLARFATKNSVWLVVLGAFAMTALDVALDPLAVTALLWRWSDGHFYAFGVPFENTLSWLIGAAIMHAFAARITRDSEAKRDVLPVIAYAFFTGFCFVSSASTAHRIVIAVCCGLPLVIAAVRSRTV